MSQFSAGDVACDTRALTAAILFDWLPNILRTGFVGTIQAVGARPGPVLVRYFVLHIMHMVPEDGPEQRGFGSSAWRHVPN